MSDLDPQALAECGDIDRDTRPGVQHVTEEMIHKYVLERGELTGASAAAFARWLDEVWNDFNEDGQLTNGDIIDGALHDWRNK
jgi:hypothetical protein